MGIFSFRKQRQFLKQRYIMAVIFCLVLMFVDRQYQVVTQPFRNAVVLIIQPVEYLIKQPFNLIYYAFENIILTHQIQIDKERALKALTLKAFNASREQWLINENQRLRNLLNLKEQIQVKTIAAEVIFHAADPFVKKIQINRGLFHGVQSGDIMINEKGVVGQVVRAYLLTSEVRLITDPEHNLPVQNLRTGQQGLLYGAGYNKQQELVELRYTPQNSDVQLNDLLITSGIDDTYIAGIPVAVVSEIKSVSSTPFLQVMALPVGLLENLSHVLIVKKVNALTDN